jgi:D-glycero-beta-D-manno-heptose 1-phosphate adenylyltransferase
MRIVRRDEITFLSSRKVASDYDEMMRTIGRRRCMLSTRVVLTQGTFDLIHMGHARYLEAAKGCGDFLVVGVDSDNKTKRRKGPNRPMIPQDERIEMLTHIEHVDLVVLKEDNQEKWSLTKLIRPDILIATETTYTEDEVEQLGEFCGEVVVLERQAETSTSARMRLMQVDGADRLAKIVTPKIRNVIEDSMEELRRGA